MIQKLNPWTQEVITEVPQQGAMEFIQALQKVKQAQEVFKKTSLEIRADALRKWAEIIAENKKEISQAVSAEQGLPYRFVFDEIVDAAQKSIENLSLDVRLFPRPELIQPTGVIGMSFAWPMAFLWMNEAMAKAIASGNGVIAKLPVLAPVSAQKISEILGQLDLPEGLIQFVSGTGAELDTLLAGHPGLQGFLYYGHHSSSAGLIESAVARRKKTQFFLGEKNSSLIHPDFDFEKGIAEILQPALTGQGQLGINAHRIFVTQTQEKKFYEVLKGYLDSMKPSKGPEDTSLWTPMISQPRIENFQKAATQVSIDQGKSLTTSQKVEGLFQAPIFTQDMSNCSELQQDEVRGPLFIVTSVKYVHEMVKWTNTGYLGGSAIFWGPQEKAPGLLSQLQVGQGLYQRWDDFLNWQVPQKQSFFGTPDVKWSGSFYSDVKKLSL